MPWLALLGLVGAVCGAACLALVHEGWTMLNKPRRYVLCLRCGETAGEVITQTSWFCKICRRVMHQDFDLYAAKLLWTGTRDERDVIDRTE